MLQAWLDPGAHVISSHVSGTQFSLRLSSPLCVLTSLQAKKNGHRQPQASSLWLAVQKEKALAFSSSVSLHLPPPTPLLSLSISASLSSWI